MLYKQQEFCHTMKFEIQIENMALVNTKDKFTTRKWLNSRPRLHNMICLFFVISNSVC